MLLIISRKGQSSLIFKQDAKLHNHIILIHLECSFIIIQEAHLIRIYGPILEEFGVLLGNRVLRQEVPENFPFF